jgi:hypothetical protein
MTVAAEEMAVGMDDESDTGKDVSGMAGDPLSDIEPESGRSQLTIAGCSWSISQIARK